MGIHENDIFYQDLKFVKCDFEYHYDDDFDSFSIYSETSFPRAIAKSYPKATA
jgi:hypothetical protein